MWIYRSKIRAFESRSHSWVKQSAYGRYLSVDADCSISVSSAGGKCMGYCKICNSLCTDYISAAYRSWIPYRNVITFPGDKRKIFTAQCLFGNMAFFGLPLVKEIFDPVAVVAFSFCVVIDNLFLWTEGVLLTSKSEGGQELSLKLIIKKLSNPVIVGVLIGLVLMILKVPSDLLILRSFDTIGSCAKPLALLYIGGTIALMESGSLKSMVSCICHNH